MLRILSEKKKMAFYHTQIGRTLPVLWEHENKDGKMYGFTENYVRVHKPFDASSVNGIEYVTLCEVHEDGSLSVESAFSEFLAKV